MVTTLARSAEAEEALTQASIYDARSIRVYSNAVFPESMRFKSPHSTHERGE